MPRLPPLFEVRLAMLVGLYRKLDVGVYPHKKLVHKTGASPASIVLSRC